jgi:hypothetical protein
MNTDSLTIGEVREILSQFGHLVPTTRSKDLGSYVVVRTKAAGVHCGILWLGLASVPQLSLGA